MLSIQGKDKQKRPITTAIKIDCCLAASSSADAELTEIRRQGGAVIESGVMTPISEEYFTNYPDAHLKH